MATSRRTHRYSHELQHWLSSKFLTDIADPVLKNLRVLEVEVSPDLRSTKIHYVMAGSQKVSPNQLAKAVERVTPYLRRAMGQELQLRSIPELRFILDESFDDRQRLAVALELGQVPAAGEVL